MEIPKHLKYEDKRGYFINYSKDIDGKTKRTRLSLGTHDLEVALIKYRKNIDKIKTGVTEGGITGTIPFDRIEELYKKTKHFHGTPPKTIKRDQNHFDALRKFLSPAVVENVRKLNLEHCQDWKNKRSKTPSGNKGDIPTQRTINNDISKFREMWRISESHIPNLKNHWLDLELFKGIQAKGSKIKTELVGADEVKQFLEKCKLDPFAMRKTRGPADPLDWFRIFSVYFGTGLRYSELKSLEWQDVDLEKNLIHIKGVKDYELEGQNYHHETKGKKDRSIPMFENVYEVLKNAPRFCSVVFPRITLSRIDRKFKYFTDLIGRPDVTELHSTRRTFAINARLAGIPLDIVQEILGHEDIELTRKIYGKYQNESGLAWMEKLNKFYI